MGRELFTGAHPFSDRKLRSFRGSSGTLVHAPCSQTPADSVVAPSAKDGTASASAHYGFRGSFARLAHPLSTLHAADYPRACKTRLRVRPLLARTLTSGPIAK